MQTCRVYVLNKFNQLKIYATVQVPIELELSLSAELTSLSSQSSHKIPLNNELSSDDETKFLALQAGVIQFSRKFSAKCEEIQNSNASSFDASSILRSVSRVEKQEKQQVMQKREKASFDESQIIRSLNREEKEEKEEKKQKIQQKRVQMPFQEQKVGSEPDDSNKVQEVRNFTKKRKSSCETKIQINRIKRHSFKQDLPNDGIEKAENENKQNDDTQKSQCKKMEQVPSESSSMFKRKQKEEIPKQQKNDISQLDLRKMLQESPFFQKIISEEKEKILRRQIIEELQNEDENYRGDSSEGEQPEQEPYFQNDDPDDIGASENEDQDQNGYYGYYNDDQSDDEYY